MPLSTALPDSGSRQSSSSRSLRLAPGRCAASERRVPARLWPQPCGRLTTPGIMSPLSCTRASMAACAARMRAMAAVGQTQALRVVGMDQRGAALGPFGQQRQVVHPAVVRAYFAPADDDHGRGLPRQILGRPLQVGQQRGRRQFDLARGRAQHFRIRGASSPRSMPPGAACTLARFRPSGFRPNPSP